MAKSKSTTNTGTKAPKSSAGTEAAPEADAKPKAPKSVELAQYPEVMVAPKDVKVRVGWNARHYFDSAEVEALADSMVRVGQLSPIVVCDDGAGGFWVVAGEKRLRAARHGRMTQLRAIVIPEALALSVTWDENAKRSAITQPDECMWFKDRLDAGATPEELAALTGRERSTIVGRAGIARGLVREVWEEWSKYPSGHGTIALVLYSKSPEEQRRRWMAYMSDVQAGVSADSAAKRKDDGTGPKPGSGKAAPSNLPTKGDVAKVYEEVATLAGWLDGRKDAEGQEAWCAGCKWALEYLAGHHTGTDGTRDFPAYIENARKAMSTPPRQLTLGKP